jgi:hypothetical protein
MNISIELCNVYETAGAAEGIQKWYATIPSPIPRLALPTPSPLYDPSIPFISLPFILHPFPTPPGAPSPESRGPGYITPENYLIANARTCILAHFFLQFYVAFIHLF